MAAGFLQICRDNIYVILHGDYKKGVIDLNTLGNPALFRLLRKSVIPPVKGLPRLTKRQRAAVRRFYSPYLIFPSTRYHRLCTAKSRRFSPRYLPEELHGLWIDRYFSDREEARYLDNKCYYYRLFSDIKQPELVAMRIGGTWLDGSLTGIPSRKLRDILAAEPEVVLKKAVNSEGGFGVHFLSEPALYRDFLRAMKDISCDVVLQRPVRQHPQMAELHPQSVNTLRIVSLLTEDRVKIYAAAVKIGAGGSRTDNGCQGGIYCGVKKDGRLGDYGVLDDGAVVHRHPSLGYQFSEKRIPHLDRAAALVKKAHSFMGHFRLIGWDIAIDEQGDAVMIEANLSLGGITDIQMCCGPLFGKDTEKILDEALQGKRRATALL